MEELRHAAAFYSLVIRRSLRESWEFMMGEKWLLKIASFVAAATGVTVTLAVLTGTEVNAWKILAVVVGGLVFPIAVIAIMKLLLVPGKIHSEQRAEIGSFQEKRQATIEELFDLIKEGVQIQNRPCTADLEDEQAVEAWITQYHDDLNQWWWKDVYPRMLALNRIAARRFEIVANFPTRILKGVNSRHAKWRSFVAVRLQHIKEFIDRVSSQHPKP